MVWSSIDPISWITMSCRKRSPRSSCATWWRIPPLERGRRVDSFAVVVRQRSLPMRTSIAIALFALTPACARACGCESPPPALAPPKTAPAVLVVPRLGSEALTLDGELGEDSWKRAARTGAFVDAERAAARPYSEARFLHDGDTL